MPTIRLARCALILAGAAISFAPSAARAEDWTYQSEAVESRAQARVRFSTDLGLWVADFRRPARACDLSRVPTVTRLPGGIRVDDGADDPACYAGRSSEVGVATGVAVAFRVASPLYLTAGLELMYTSPTNPLLKNQLVVPVPFGLLFTEYSWAVRPIVHATITPILYVTDDARDYTFGADLGVAWRVMTWGDLSLSAGYRGAATVDAWRVEIALHPVP